jgi:hypothetical protein
MKFVCGNCEGTIREGNYSKHHASFVPHEECGFETFFATHVPTKQNPDPTPGEVRKIQVGLPSDADLDAVAEEDRIKAETENESGDANAEVDARGEAEEVEVEGQSKKSRKAKK